MTKQAGRFAKLIAAVGLLIFIIGFTGQDSSLPPGVYTTTLTAKDLPSDFPMPPEYLIGKWEITFTKDNRCRVIKDGEFGAEGGYTSMAEQLVIEEGKGPLSCAPAPGGKIGTYKWKLEGNKLTLTAVEDKCGGRRVVLTARPLEKSQSQDSSLPPGVYTTTITAKDIPSDFPIPPDYLIGKQEITFSKENRYRLTKDGELAVEGRHASTAERVVFTDEKGPFSCARMPGGATGTYKWKLDGNKLIFTAVEDKCLGRKVSLTARPWEKSQ
ncbi:MAG: hypothetical protein ACREEM_38420 [Blastocatellia bacterium]